jgi:hypothetical protein
MKILKREKKEDSITLTIKNIGGFPRFTKLLETCYFDGEVCDMSMEKHHRQKNVYVAKIKFK